MLPVRLDRILYTISLEAGFSKKKKIYIHTHTHTHTHTHKHEGWNFNFGNTPLDWIQELLE